MFDWRKLWQPAQTELTQFWGVEWSTEGLIGAVVRLNDGKVTLTDQFTIPFTQDRTPDRAAAEIAAELAEKTVALGANAPCLLVVPRETVVIRQLQLPLVPEDELPALVGFQAAAKSSTPTAAIAVDYVTLGPAGEGQAVIVAMLDSVRFQRIRDLITRAKLQLVGVEVSPFLIAELVAREEEQGGTPDVPTLIVAQSGDRVEISILDRRRLIATHAVWLPEGDAMRHVSPLQTEINRCLIALSQSHPGVEIDQVYLLQDQAADEAVTQVLNERFGTKVHPLNLKLLGTAIPDRHRMSYAGLVARGLTGAEGIIPRVDLLNPRKPKEKPDYTKRYLAAGGLAATLLLGGTWWNFQSQMTDMDLQIEELTTEINSHKADINNGKAELEAARVLTTWQEGRQDQLVALDAIHSQLPGTDRLYFVDLKSIPSSGAKQLKVTATARARDREDVDDLLQKLADAGWQVKPISPIETKKDPDYPWQFIVEAELLRTVEEQPASAPAADAPPSSSKTTPS